jgi:hypothetical protein
MTSRLLTSRVIARSRRLGMLEKAMEIEEHGTGCNETELPTPPVAATKGKARRKRKSSAKTRAKISRALKGRRKPTETRRKISETLQGHPVSEETRAKLSRAMKGHRMPPKTRAKISKTLQGHPVSEETREKISRKVSLSLRGQGSPSFWHGAYAAPAHPVETVADVIADLSAKQGRLSALLDQYLDTDEGLTPQLVTLFALHSQNAGKLAQMLRHQKGEAERTAADELRKAMDEALDELAKETGLEL